MTTTEATKKYDVIGTRPIRHDGLDKVTGRARYGADVVQTDLLHTKILRSPYAHARILSIDVEKAKQVGIKLKKRSDNIIKIIISNLLKTG